jgi:hypothetical protein
VKGKKVRLRIVGTRIDANEIVSGGVCVLCSPADQPCAA